MRDTQARAESTVAGTKAPPPRILIAEDERAFRELLLCAFHGDGYDVVGVANGPELRELLGASLSPGSPVPPFDLVVSDIVMPGGGGLEILEALRAVQRLPPVVIMTAFGSADVHDRARRAGACAVLDKPFDIAELTALGDRLLGQRAP